MPFAFPRIFDRAIEYLRSEPTHPALTKHLEAELPPKQVREKAEQYLTDKRKSDTVKQNRENAGSTGTRITHTSFLERLQQWKNNKITGFRSSIEKTNSQWNIAGWGIGTISRSSIISFERSKQVINIFGFKTRLYTPSFFDYRSTTIDKPVKRLAARQSTKFEKDNKYINLVNSGIKVPVEIPFETPEVKTVELPKAISYKILSSIKEKNQIFVSDIKSTKGRYIPGASSSTANGPLVDSQKRILDHLKIIDNQNNKKMTGTPDENMKLLSLAFISVASDANIKNKGNSSKLTYVEDFVEAIRILRELSLENSFTKIAEAPVDIQHAAIGNTAHLDLAWRIAYKLAETPMGFDLLKLITAPSTPTAPLDLQAPAGAPNPLPNLKKQIRQDARIRLFMQGANELMKQKHDVPEFPSNPAALIDYCLQQSFGKNTSPNTLLIRALPALQFSMCEESSEEDLTNYRTARDEKINGWSEDPTFLPQGFNTNPITRASFKKLSESTWAVNAMRNGFFTNAPGSEFDKANKRLEKVSVQLTRALQNKDIACTRDEIIEVKKIEDQGRLYRWMKPLKLSGKSMFNNSLYCGISSNGALIQRDKMQLASRLLKKLLTEVGGLTADNRLAKIQFNDAGNKLGTGFDFTRFVGKLNTDQKDNNKKLIENVAKILMLKSWISMPPSEIISGYPLPPTEIFKDERLDFLGKMFCVDINKETISLPGSMAFFTQVSLELRKLSTESLTPELLGGWASGAGIKRPPLRNLIKLDNTCQTDANKSIPNQQEIDDMQPAEYPTNFFDALDHLIIGMDNEEISHVNFTRQGTIDYLKAQVERMRLGSSVKMTDGAAIGVSLQGTFSAISRVSTAFLASGRASFSKRLGRVAEMGIGVNAAGGFARFGVQTDQRTRAGGGGSIGWRIGKKDASVKGGLSAAADVKGVYDSDQFEGVSLRLDRLGGDITGTEGQVPGVAGDAAMTKKLSEIVEKVMKGRAVHRDGEEIPEGVPENYASPNLLEQLLEGKDGAALSVTWIDKKNSGTRTTGVTEQISAIAGVHVDGIGGAALSASASATQTINTRHQEEETGALRSRFISTGYSNVGTLQASATLGLQNSEIGNDPRLAKFGITGAELALADAEVYRGGVMSDIRTIELNGVLQPRTYRILVHANAKSFIDSVKQPENIARWAHAFAQIKHPLQYNAATNDIQRSQEERLAVVSEQYDVVQDILQESADQADPNVYHIEYYEIRQNITDKINLYNSLAIMSRKVADLKHQNQAAVFEAAAEFLLNNKDSYSERFLFSIQKSAFEEGKKVNFVGNFQSTSKIQATTMVNKGFWG